MSALKCFFLRLLYTCEETCESVWPPKASLLACVAGGIFAHECFCFSSEVVNTSGEAVRGLVKRRDMAALPLALSRIPPATHATSLYASSTCGYLRLLASPFDQGLKIESE